MLPKMLARLINARCHFIWNLAGLVTVIRAPWNSVTSPQRGGLSGPPWTFTRENTYKAHPTSHENVIMKKKEIIWAGGLPHLARLPHLPRVPHLHANRPLISRYSFISSSEQWVEGKSLQLLYAIFLRDPFKIKKSSSINNSNDNK